MLCRIMVSSLFLLFKNYNKFFPVTFLRTGTLPCGSWLAGARCWLPGPGSLQTALRVPRGWVLDVLRGLLPALRVGLKGKRIK